MRFLTPGFLLFAATCGSDSNAVLVTLTNPPSRATKLEVSATLAGKPAMSVMDVTNPLDRFGVRFDASATGHVQLAVKALDDEDCSHGDGMLGVDLPTDFASQSLSLNPHSPRLCGKGSLPGCATGSVCAGTKVGNYTFEGFWAFSPSDIWGVGHSGTIVHYDGASWTPYAWGSGNPQPTEDFYAIWGSSPTDIWAVGSLGLMARYDGSKWTKRSFNTTQQLNSVWGVSATSIWAVGTSPTPGTEQGIFLEWDGTQWRSIVTAGTAAFNGVWADNSSGAKLVYACGDNGLLVRFDASSMDGPWNSIISMTTNTLKGIWGTRAPNTGKFGSTLFAVGTGGTILRINYGDASPGWTNLTQTGTSLTLYGVRGDDTKNLVYAYGQNGAVVSAAIDASNKFTALTGNFTNSIFGGIFSTGDLIWLGSTSGAIGFIDLNP
jgi:hypothetical protein